MTKDKVLALAESWKGQRNKIVDIYNTHKPLARGYTVKYQDALCATYVSALFIELGLTDLVPPECGAMQLMRNMQALGRWEGPDEHRPAPGDLIFFDYQGDGWADHVGLVTDARGSVVVYSHIPSYSVTTNEVYKFSKTIIGYGFPDYAIKDGVGTVAEVITEKRIFAGDMVHVKTGARWYNGSTIQPFVFERCWQVIQVNGDRAVLGMDKDGRYNIQSPIHVADLTKTDSAIQTTQEPEMFTVPIIIPRSVYECYGSPEAIAAFLENEYRIRTNE